MNIIYSIFPKFFSSVKLEDLPGFIRDIGLDTVNMTIREGYWVSNENLATEAPAFVKAMEKAGLKIHFATAGWGAERITSDDTPLRILADCGVREFRMGYFRSSKDANPAEGLEKARKDMADVAKACERTGTRAVYQVHHGTLITNSVAAWTLVKDLPPSAVSIMLDPGNQANEGRENWNRAARLLGPYLSSWGIKDTMVTRDESKHDEPSKGWKRDWVPCDEGDINWYEVLRACRTIDFDGTFVFMPFYNQGQKDVMQKKLVREVAYVRKVMEEVQKEEAAGATA